MTDARQVLDLLIAARDNILDPEDWCQGQMSVVRQQFRDGRVDYAYCAKGSLNHVSLDVSNSVYNAVQRILNIAAEEISRVPRVSYPIFYVNDRLGHAAVLDMYDRAICLAKEAADG